MIMRVFMFMHMIMIMITFFHTCCIFTLCLFRLTTIVIFFLARMGVVDHKWLAKNRKFALLMAFVFGAVLTPPDLFSQVSIALPFIVLYEVGILAARMFGKKKVEEEGALEDEDTPAE